MSYQESQSVERSVILPQRTARELVGILGDKEGSMRVVFSAAQVIFDYAPTDDFSQPHIQIVSRLIEGEYPRYQDIIPAEYKTRVQVSKTELVNHIRASGVFSGKTNEVRVRVVPDQNGLVVSSHSSDVGEQESFLEGEVQGEEVEAAFNWRFLVEGIAAIQGERLELGLSGEDGPAAVKPIEQEGYLYIVMPIKNT